MTTTSQKTLRRRRGREIRRARRRPRPTWLERALCRLATGVVNVLRDIGTTVLVAMRRIVPLLFTPRNGAGARRQLLDHGRAPKERR